MSEMADKIKELYNEVATPLITTLIVISAVVAAMVGAKFIMAGGDPEKIKKAKEQVKYYIIGWIVIFALTALTPTFVGALQTWAQN
ncbi:MAG: pilin [Prevotella sp.]|nr:pilin [Prevotella sp.]